MSLRWLVEEAIAEASRDIEFGLHPSEEVRLYNLESRMADEREAEFRSWFKQRGVKMADGGGESIPLGFTYGAMMSAVSGITDLAKMAAQITLLNRMKIEWIPNAVNFPMALSSQAKGLSLEDLRSKVLETINRDYDYLVYAWNTGIETGLGAAFASYQEQFMASGQLRYAYGDLQYQTSILPRMKRYWMKEYTPSVPDPSMAHTLLHRGKINDAQFEEYASYAGWDKKSADFLRSLWRQIPNENAAFRMFARGKMTWQELEKVYYANSWEKEDFAKLTGLYEWLPNAREGFALFKRGHIKEDKMHGFFSSQGYMKDSWAYLPKMWERLPTPHDAFNMMMRGAINQEKFDKYVEANEWEDGSAEKLRTIFQNLPGAKQAFTLFKRGVLKKDAMTTLMQADGYMPVWQKALPSLFERIPHPKDAFNAYMRGKIDKKAFDKWVESNEWQTGMSDFLYDIYTRLPSIREAFYMWAKGIIDTNQRDQLYLAAGYDKEWHSKLTENEYYIPTVYDLTRIADFVEIDSIWATKILKERGVRDRDITKILAMLKIRPLRDEIRRQIALWVYRYRMGWASPVELEAALQAYLDGGFIQATEKDFTTQEAELNYEDELMYEKIQIYSWYFKTAVISEEDLLQDFLDLGIREEKANLMVEGLKAQGYYGYY
jgi:hypothetical protein